MSDETVTTLSNVSKIETLNDNEMQRSSSNQKNSESDVDSDSYSHHNLKYETQLKDKPEILEFLLRQGKRIKKLEKKLKKLKSKLKKYSKTKTVNVSTQTDIFNNHLQLEANEPKSITEEIKEAAENAMHQTGFVYEATSGMYYDYNTGYYYNAELGLYYDGNNGTYLTYNNDTKTYEFHSQIKVNSEEKDTVKRKKHHKKQVKHDFYDGLVQNFSQLNIDQSRSNALEISKQWPPCIRIILKESTIESLKIGSLFIITCDGGTVGREGNHSILIPDINVSKNHAQISFDKEIEKYVITDVGSQNGTILNGKRISAAKQTSEPQEIIHGSVIQFGTTKLLCHIHDGQKTCGHCEPGLIQIEKAPVLKSKIVNKNKNTQYKQEMGRLKKKYGLEEPEENSSELPSGYSDRAKERRLKVGSHDNAEKTKSASLHETIPSDNMGFKMLSKMGWTEGQTLGKNNDGLLEPVPLISNEGTTGLGSTFPQAGPLLESTDRKTQVWKKTQERFQKVQELRLEAFKESESEEET